MPERHQWHCFVVFIINCEHIAHFFLVFLLLTLNRKMFVENVWKLLVIVTKNSTVDDAGVALV